MVGIGLAMIAIGFIGALLWARGTLFSTRWYLSLVQHAWPLGFIAILAGWWVTETGRRQPWLVTGILRTKDAVSPVEAWAVLTTLVLFVFIYTSVFSMGIYYINKLIEKGPSGAAITSAGSVPTRPLSAAEDAAREAVREGT